MVESKHIIVAGLAGAAALAATYFLLKRSPSKNEEENESSTEVIASAPELEKEKLVKILGEMTAMMNTLVVQLAQSEQKLRRDVLATGRVTEDELAAYLLKQFEENMKQIEARVYSRYETQEEEVAQATDYYAADPEVSSAVKSLTMLINMVMGHGSDTPVPEKLTLSLVISIMEESMSKMNDMMDEIAAEVKRTGLSETDSEYQEVVVKKYMEGVDGLTQSVHSKHGVTREEFQAAMMHYQHETALLTKMMEMQQEQLRRFAACGVRPMGAE